MEAVSSASEHDRKAIDNLVRESLAYNTGDRMRELFSFIGTIPYYSPYNAMLLHIQNPKASLVLTVSRWAELGRSVKLGSRPLVILATMGPVGFVFDVADTEGAPLPPLPELGNLFANPFDARGEPAPKMWERVLKSCEKLGVIVKGGPDNIMKAGRIENRQAILRVQLNANHPKAVQFTTLAHELAHLFCGHIGFFKGLCQDRQRVSHPSAEIEAEAAAFLVAQRHGIKLHSEAYLAAFVNGAQFSLDTILVAAGKIDAMCNGTFRNPTKDKAK